MDQNRRGSKRSREEDEEGLRKPKESQEPPKKKAVSV